MRNNRWLTASASASAFLLALAGCSSTDSEDGDTSSPASSSSDDVDAAPANPGEDPDDDTSDEETPEDDEGDDSSESSSPSSTQSDAEEEKIAKQMAPGDVDKEQLAAVEAYLGVRENSESVRYKDPKEWEAALKKVTTSDGFKVVRENYRPEDVSNARQVAMRLGYEVKVVAGECKESPGFGGSKNTLAVQCSLTDLVTDKKGKTITSTEIDNTWPYFGKRQSPMVVLAKEGGKWLVDGDYTGRAS